MILLEYKGDGITEKDNEKELLHDNENGLENEEQQDEQITQENCKTTRKKILIGFSIAIGVLLIIYLSIALYFTNHFYFGTTINGINASGKTIDQVENSLLSALQGYTLDLKERGNKTEQLQASDIALKYDSLEPLENLKDRQKPFKWISCIFNKSDNVVSLAVSYDRTLLQKQLEKLTCLAEANIIEPKNATFKYADNNFVIVNEVLGNKIDKDILFNQIETSILKEDTALNLEEINCYIDPKYTSKTEKIIETKNLLNKYISSKITYNIGGKSEVIDGSIINKWLSVGEDLAIKFDIENMKSYVTGLLSSFNTVGKSRSFTTSTGRLITVSGGDYGYSINTSKEALDLISAIKEGQSVLKEPKYSQTAFSYGSNDIGNTYVEIDLTNQHLWFYKNGTLITQGNVVTGNVSAGHTTPPGIFRLKYTQKDAVLRGPGYAAPVTFWMPFNGGIGIHDASWRSEFGGYIYKTDGSHGCVNCPYALAKAIFDNIEAGTPVVCYN